MPGFPCGHCGLDVTASAEQVGRTIRCPYCGEANTVPDAQAPSPPPHAQRGPPAPRPGGAVPAGRRYAGRTRGPVPAGSNALAVVALVLGILTVVLFACLLFVRFTRMVVAAEVLCAVVGAIVSVMALQQARQVRRGKGMALAGLTLCLVPMVPAVGLVIFYW